MVKWKNVLNWESISGFNNECCSNNRADVVKGCLLSNTRYIKLNRAEIELGLFTKSISYVGSFEKVKIWELSPEMARKLKKK